MTPLLNQWTYQAMVHELLGIDNNRVDLRGKPGVPSELEQIVLSSDQVRGAAATHRARARRWCPPPRGSTHTAHRAASQDAFFTENMLLNYGDLADNVKRLLESFQARGPRRWTGPSIGLEPRACAQAKTQSSKTIASVSDMQKFVEEYPQFKKLSGDVSKHVTLLGEINRLVDTGNLMEVSQVAETSVERLPARDRPPRPGRRAGCHGEDPGGRVCPAGGAGARVH